MLKASENCQVKADKHIQGVVFTGVELDWSQVKIMEIWKNSGEWLCP